MRCVPISATHTSMQYEVYRHTDCTDTYFQETDEFMKQIENEDRVICTRVQKNLNSGVYDIGPLHAHREKGVGYFQGLVRDVLSAHHREEQQRGYELWPALQTTGRENSNKDKKLCADLCASKPAPELSW